MAYLMSGLDVFEKNGEAVAAGSVYFYDSGTTTLKTVYSDPGLTTPLANPHDLNAEGKLGVNVYCPDGERYTIRVMDGLAGAGTQVDSLDNVWGAVEELEAELTPEQYLATGDGETDDSSAFQSFLTALNGRPGYLTPGAVYNLESGVSLTGVPLRLYGNGATILQGADVVPLSLTGGLTDEADITASSTNTVTVATGSPILTALNTKILNEPVVKVVSDDAFGTSNSEEMKGELIRVSAVDTGTGVITFSHDLVDTYTTNPRIALMDESKIVLEDINFDTADLSWSNALFIGTSLKDPEFRNISATKSNSTFLLCRSSYAPRFENINSGPLLDNAPTQLGYGVSLTSCEHAIWDGGVIYNSRHAFTTNMAGGSADRDISKYGPTRYASVTNVIAYRSSDSAFDTHAGDQHTTFDNCVSVLGAGAGFKTRSDYTKFVDCQSIQDEFGYRTADDADNTEFHNCQATGTKTVTLFLESGGDATFYGGKFEGGVDGNELFRATNGTFTFRQMPVFSLLASGEFSKVFRMTSSTLKGEMVLDMENATGTSMRPFEFTSGGDNEVLLDNLVFKFATGGLTSLIRDLSGETTNKAIIQKCQLSEKLNLSDDTLDASSGWRYTTDNGYSSKSVALSVAADDPDMTQAVQYSLEHDFAIRAETTVASDLGTIPVGSQQGQLLKIINRNDSTQNLTVEHGGGFNTNLTGGSNVALAPGQAMPLEFDGTTWNQYTIV